ncbi:acyl-CoA-binding protein-like [Musca vetustissima]|uniref:acyl-CoA-binding protein-like n=1 Tax=Musca vetustissima TaxID=27455 RepID=UPI002AB75C94|nr:acyl-CoA-binding protein-like [Musca vetustissima]
MDFDTATEKMKAFTKTPPDNVILELYSLYKQSTVGDCNIEQPVALDLKDKAKWNAWNEKKGMSQDDARAAYIAAYEKYAPLYA